MKFLVSLAAIFLGGLFGGLLAGPSSPAAAQSLPASQVRAPCGAGLVHFQMPGPRVHLTAAQFASAPPGSLKIDFAGHSTFLITSPQGIKVATDYNDFHRAKELPDIATMSGWHYNHSTSSIEPSITHALYGWDRGLGPPRHDVTMKDLRVYSVPANIGLSGDFFRFPTAVFVIESNGICVAHLGLVGEVLAQDALSRIGKIDVLLVPVDQRVTLSISETVANIKAINPKIVIPMHYNAEMTVEHFLAEVKSVFPVIRPESGTLIANRATLPTKTEVHFLVPPTFGRGL